jgi:hypothetical protein
VDADIAAAATRVARALERVGVEYAIGGALALGIHGALRATRDVDVNVFCDPSHWTTALAALANAGVSVDEPTALRDAANEGWFTGWLDSVRIDVLWFLSAESLCIFKLLFFRTKDLADLEQLVRTTVLDRAWVRDTIASMMGTDDPRIPAWDHIAGLATH